MSALGVIEGIRAGFRGFATAIVATLATARTVFGLGVAEVAEVAVAIDCPLTLPWIS